LQQKQDFTFIKTLLFLTEIKILFLGCPLQHSLIHSTVLTIYTSRCCSLW